MKKVTVNIKTLLTAIVILMVSGLYAQEGGDVNKGERIEALRVAYISQELGLTPAEAQKFWPVYNQYRGDMEVLRKNFRPGQGQMTAEQQLDFDQKKLDLKKKYKLQFESTLGKEKCNKLYGLEDKFREKMKALRDQRQQMKGDRPGMGKGLAPK